ncbi:hypothetical protein Y032_0013g1961 [Ancylostoma ceylanicum]|uniref:Uncharacterized protein n=1 Tax=Ancylostoma ceylanicum TaxID=53326 RepID=A0A016VA92_9BILA|nr:hypothetical protein Y032_0013g1961 [Ancylostoma ceylanicum]
MVAEQSSLFGPTSFTFASDISGKTYLLNFTTRRDRVARLHAVRSTVLVVKLKDVRICICNEKLIPLCQ